MSNHNNNSLTPVEEPISYFHSNMDTEAPPPYYPPQPNYPDPGGQYQGPVGQGGEPGVGGPGGGYHHGLGGSGGQRPVVPPRPNMQRPAVPPRPDIQIQTHGIPQAVYYPEGQPQHHPTAPHSGGYGNHSTAPYGQPTVVNQSNMATEQPQQQHNDESINNFSEKSIRLGFIKKVFGILFIQLLITSGLMCIFIFIPVVKRYLRRHDWLYITSICLTIVLMAVFAFIPKLRRQWPWNMVFLVIITLVMSTMLGSVASSMDTDEVLIAVGIVAAVVLVCAILGFQKKFDFTPLVGFVAMLGMCVSAFAFLNIFFYNRVLSIVYAALGAFVFSMWLLLDIQLLLKGKHKLSLHPEEYVSGALNFYVDIVYILLMVFYIFKRT